ncbi:hypothetical protein ACFWU5_16855 [Nocardia sp. NPDC058640]|uniref:hypothetical protein n=1 Tax=Nocardia sp. NPDC058640 TaxID=3346571 RepID=UPI0036601E88
MELRPDYSVGTWLAYPTSGGRAGEGGDCYEVAAFADDELACLRYCNTHDGYKAAYLLPGQTLLQAVRAMENHRD